MRNINPCFAHQLNAKVVKSYTIYGFENLENSSFPDYAVKPVMLIAGDEEQSKKEVTLINTDLGFETLDTGGLSQALHLEHMSFCWLEQLESPPKYP